MIYIMLIYLVYYSRIINWNEREREAVNDKKENDWIVYIMAVICLYHF